MRACPSCHRHEIECFCRHEPAELCAECREFPVLADDVWVACQACGKEPLCDTCTENCEAPDCVAPICQSCSNDMVIVQRPQRCRDCRVHFGEPAPAMLVLAVGPVPAPHESSEWDRWLP